MDAWVVYLKWKFGYAMAGGRTDDDDIPIYRTKCPVCRQGIDIIARLKTHGAPHRADSSLKIKV